MNTHTFILISAICALWLSISCGCFVVYALLSSHDVKAATGAAKTKLGSPAPASDAPLLLNEEQTSWEIQVLFKSPSPALNQRLSLALASLEANYEPESRTFKVTDDSSRTPIRIENVSASGKLPSVTENSAELPPINGVSIKLIKTNQMLTPSKLQLAKLVSISKKLARLGGTVVDSAQKPITQGGFHAVIAGNAKV